jgi:hypothetical protein
LEARGARYIYYLKTPDQPHSGRYVTGHNAGHKGMA